MTDLTIQRIVLPSSVETSELYWRHHGAGDRPRASAEIVPGTELDLDTYFNSFDENVWRRHTNLGALTVTLQLEGVAKVELWRHSRAAPPALLAEAMSADGTISLHVERPWHDRIAGRLALRILVGKRSAAAAVLKGGSWTTEAAPSPVRLMPVICTFDRDRPLADVLRRLGQDAQALAALHGVVVINNGTPGLPMRLAQYGITALLGPKLHVIEQENVGGAGGFTRGLLAAKDLGASHAILMDDDVILEPEAVLRTQRMYALARHDFVVAGHMLDLYRPTHLFEAGARLDDRKLSVTPLHSGAELSHLGSLNRFLDDLPMHYNGWWFLGLPLALLEQVGLPMPCFIRGDDVEFGRRLHDHGVPQVAMAGIGIWHEPFYAKLGSWHIYYETRNMFVLAARHLPGSPRRIGFVALNWIVAELLMFRYQRAALQIRAVQDFLDGPAIFDADPRQVHASLADIRTLYPVEVAARGQILHQPHPEIGPRSRTAFVVQLLRALVSEWMRPDGGHRVIAVEPRDHIWFRVRRADAVIVREAWEIDQPRYRRSRKKFRHLLGEVAKLCWRMRELPAAVGDWRVQYKTFTSEPAWRTYLELHAAPLEDRTQRDMAPPEYAASDLER